MLTVFMGFTGLYQFYDNVPVPLKLPERYRVLLEYHLLVNSKFDKRRPNDMCCVYDICTSNLTPYVLNLEWFYRNIKLQVLFHQFCTLKWYR